MPIDPTAVRTPRRDPSRRPARRRRFERIPLTIRYGLPILIVALVAREAWLAYGATRAHLRLVDVQGEPVQLAATVEFFEYDPRPSAPSPTASLGTRELDPTGGLSVGRDLIGDAALVRFESPDHGIAFGYLEPGGDVCDVVVGQPRTVDGIVRDQEGKPVANARVQAFGGGPRGVLLGETETGADGRFRFGGISDSVRNWSFRVFADGYALGQHDWLSSPDETVDVRLAATRPAKGCLVLESASGADVVPDVGGQELRIFHLPGVTARTAADGSFSVPFLPPPPMRAYLLVPDLPGGWTYRRTALRAGESTDVHIMPARRLRGRVVNGHDQRGVSGATVHHDHGPDGQESVVTDADGRFELGRVPLGPVEIYAHLFVSRLTVPADARKEKGRGERVLIQGHVPLLMRPDVDPGEIVITVW